MQQIWRLNFLLGLQVKLIAVFIKIDLERLRVNHCLAEFNFLLLSIDGLLLIQDFFTLLSTDKAKNKSSFTQCLVFCHLLVA